MRKGLIFATLYELTIIFEKESFIDAKKVLNFIQNLVNEKKVRKSLTGLHIYLCVIRDFSTEAQCVAVNNSYFSHQSSIAKTPFTHFISLRRSVYFFSTC